MTVMVMFTGTRSRFAVFCVMMSAAAVVVQQLVPACRGLLLHQFVVRMVQDKIETFQRQRDLTQAGENIGFRTEQAADLFFLF